MFSSLIFRNSSRSRKENGLFFSSLVISIVAFYMILSISTQDVILLLLCMDCFCTFVLWISDIQAFQTLIGFIVLSSILLFSAILFQLNKQEITRQTLFRDFLSDPDSSREERLIHAVSPEEEDAIRLLASVLRENKAACRSMEDALLDYEEYAEGWAHEIKMPLSLLTVLLDNHTDELPHSLQTKLDYIRSSLQEDVTQMLYYARLKSSTKTIGLKQFA